MNVECKSAVTADPGDYLVSDDVAAWIGHVPAGAVLTAITREHGSQRDPITVLVGLRATWTEARP